MTVLFYFFFFFCEKQKITRAYACIYIRMYARKNKKKKKKYDFRDIFAKICRFAMVRSDIFAVFIIFFIFFLLEIGTFRP